MMKTGSGTGQQEQLTGLLDCPQKQTSAQMKKKSNAIFSLLFKLGMEGNRATNNMIISYYVQILSFTTKYIFCTP